MITFLNLKSIQLLQPVFPLLAVPTATTFDVLWDEVHSPTIRRALLQLPNMHWMWHKPYADLAAYLRWFDVATIPFKLNDLTHAISPVNLFEYFAGGKPVVATSMDETLQYPGSASQGIA